MRETLRRDKVKTWINKSLDRISKESFENEEERVRGIMEITEKVANLTITKRQRRGKGGVKVDLTGVGWGARMREWAENIMATKTDEVLAMSCDNVRIIQSKSHDGKRKRCERRYERGGWIKTESLGGGRETVECEGVEKLRNKIEDLVDRIPAMMIECTDATKKNECQEHDIDADGVAVEEAGDGVEFDVSISTSLAGKTAGSIFTTRAGKSAGSISTS